MATYKFPKKSRISSKNDFRAILDYKLFNRNELMTLYMALKSTEKPRFAVSISAKTAPAAVRNRLKRLAREAFRLCQDEIADGFDYFVIYSARLSKKPSSDIKKITLSQVKQGFLELAEQGRRRFEKERNK
jgi:ribonuclease P protein component